MMFSAIRDKETYNAYFQSLVDWLVEVQGLNFQEATAALAIARELNFVAGVAEQASVLKGRFLEKTEESRTHNPLVSRLADPEGWAGHLLDKLGKWERYGLGRVKNSHAFSQVEVNFAGGRKRFSYWLAANWKSDQNKIEPTPFEFPKIQPESVFARYQNRIEVASQEFKKVFTGAE
jgi:hypothetical protein